MGFSFGNVLLLRADQCRAGAAPFQDARNKAPAVLKARRNPRRAALIVAARKAARIFRMRLL
jgi:hypothetical protein